MVPVETVSTPRVEPEEPVLVKRTNPGSPRDLESILRAYEAVVDANIAASASDIPLQPLRSHAVDDAPAE